MRVMYVTEEKPSQYTPDEASAFEASDNLFSGCLISVLAENLLDTYIRLTTGKQMWDALEAQYGVFDAGSELYIMEQFLDYRMVEDRSVVEQAHEIHMLAKDLKNCSKEAPCVLPDKFVAGGIISKLPPSWKDFATSLDVEEKARANVLGRNSWNF